jgi:hypothetical protein
MDQSQFLHRVRQAARQGHAFRIEQPRFDPSAGYVGAGDDPPQRMADEVRAVGGIAHLVPDLPAVQQLVRQLLQAPAAAATPAASDVATGRTAPTPLGSPGNPPAVVGSSATASASRLALCWEHPLLQRLELPALLASAGYEMLTHSRLAQLPPDVARRQMLQAAIGITSATYAVAETGSLAMAAGPGSERAASLLPPWHLAIVDARQIVADLFDLFDRLAADGLHTTASNVTLITGPSKTGDIGLQLTTGVHGPGRFEVVICRQPLLA